MAPHSTLKRPPDLYDVNHGWRTQTELVLALPSHSLPSSPASHPPPWLTVPSGMICEFPETCGCSIPGLCLCPPPPGTLSLDFTRQFIQSPAHSEMFPAPHLELSPSSRLPRPPPPTPASCPQWVISGCLLVRAELKGTLEHL